MTSIFILAKSMEITLVFYKIKTKTLINKINITYDSHIIIAVNTLIFLANK